MRPCDILIIRFVSLYLKLAHFRDLHLHVAFWVVLLPTNWSVAFIFVLLILRASPRTYWVYRVFLSSLSSVAVYFTPTVMLDDQVRDKKARISNCRSSRILLRWGFYFHDAFDVVLLSLCFGDLLFASSTRWEYSSYRYIVPLLYTVYFISYIV